MLCLNQDGFLFKGDIPSNILDELRVKGYINDGKFYELPINNNIDIEPWKSILSLYHIQDAVPEVTYINDLIQQLDLKESADKIIFYWQENYQQLDMTRPDAVKRPLRYDLSIVLSSVLKEVFSFRIGDRLSIKGLIYKDDTIKYKIIQATATNEVTAIPINQGNINFWNSNYKQGKFTIKLNDIKDIVKQRS